MPTLNDSVLDGGLVVIGTGAANKRLDICTTEPTNLTEATTTNTIGNKTGLTIAAPQDDATVGRKVVVPAIPDGTVSASATANFWAVTDGSVLLATGNITTPQAVTSGNNFTLDAIDISFLDAVTG